MGCGFLTFFDPYDAENQLISAAFVHLVLLKRVTPQQPPPLIELPVTFCLHANHGLLVSQSVISITFPHVIFAFRMTEPFAWQ